MDAAFSLSRPHEVFVDESIISGMDTEPGEPISFEIEVGDFGSSFAAPVMPIQDIDIQQEEFAIFYTLPQISTSIPDRVTAQVRESLLDDNHLVNIQNSDDLFQYIHDIQHRSILDYDKYDVVIGIGLLDIVSSIDRDDLVNTLFGQVPEDLLIKCIIENITFELSEKEYDVVEPDSVLFCTLNEQFPDKELRDIKKELIDIRYLMYGANHIITTGLYPIHGPIVKSATSEIDPVVYKLNRDNIRFDSATRIPIAATASDDLDFEEIYYVLKEQAEEFSVEKRSEGDSLVIEKESYYAQMYPTGDSLQVDLFHTFDYEEEEFVDELGVWCDALDSELNGEFTIQDPHQHPTDDALLNEVWVLDTNIVYKQYGYSNKTDICEYIFDEPKLYNKKVKIPWQVIGEINRHKEESSSLMKVSEKGLENLRSLKKLDEFGYIELQVEELPDEFDNSVHPEIGISDLGIISSVPDEGVLLSGDDRLIKLSDILGISSRNIVEEAEEGSETDIWSVIEGELQEDPKPVEDVIDQIQSSSSSENPQDHQDAYDDPPDYLKKWKSNHKIISFPHSNGIKISLSKKFEITPTYKTITRISNDIEDTSSGKMLTESFLEELRSSVGRLPKNQYPKVEFVIPEQYVYRAKEVNQVNELMKISQLSNADYRPEMVNVDRSTVQTELNEAAVKTAQSNSSIMLCDDSEEELEKLTRLINVEAVTI